MAIIERIKSIILPSLIIIGLGLLELNFPHAMDGFNDGYTGRGVAGLIVLFFELFLMLTWSKIGGILAIILGILLLVFGLFPGSKKATRSSLEIESSVNEKRKSFTTATRASLLRIGKTYHQRIFDHRKYEN